MTWPRQRSAWSEGTPALLIKLRAVLRKSCRVHPSVPDALSNAALKFEKPLIGVMPSVVNTHSALDLAPATCGPGGSSNRACAALLSGRIRSTLVLLRAAGSVQSPPSISAQVISLASLRLAPV